MKNSRLLPALFLLLTLSMSSCTVVGGIFKTGMGVGIFLVVLVVVVIIAIVARSGKR